MFGICFTTLKGLKTLFRSASPFGGENYMSRVGGSFFAVVSTIRAAYSTATTPSDLRPCSPSSPFLLVLAVYIGNRSYEQISFCKLIS